MRELYEIATEEAAEAVKQQQALELINRSVEEELLPLRMRVLETEAALQDRSQACALLEKVYEELKAESATVTALLDLKNTQLDATLQANRLLETRAASTSSSHSGSSHRERELEHQV